MKDNDIDNLFREAFHEAEETPNESVWQQIEMQLDDSQKPTIQLAGRRLNWIKYAAAAVVLIVGSIIAWKQNYSNKNILVDQKETRIVQSPKIEHETLAVDRDLNSDSKHQLVKENKREKSLTLNRPSIQVENTSKALPLNPRHELNLDGLKESKPSIAKLNHSSVMSPPVYQVTEIGEIKPLIVLDDEMESMYAQTAQESTNKNIVTTLLNSFTEKIELSATKDIRFHADEEGSFQIDILNSLVKNRNKRK